MTQELAATDRLQATNTKTGRRAVLGMLVLGSTATLVSACSASCEAQTGEAAQACQARIAERRRIRAETRPPGGR